MRCAGSRLLVSRYYPFALLHWINAFFDSNNRWSISMVVNLIMHKPPFKEWVVMSAILFGRSVSLLLHLACWRWIAPRPFQFSQLFLVLIDGNYRIMGDAIKVCGYNFCLLQSFYLYFADQRVGDVNNSSSRWWWQAEARAATFAKRSRTTATRKPLYQKVAQQDAWGSSSSCSPPSAGLLWCPGMRAFVLIFWHLLVVVHIFLAVHLLETVVWNFW